MTAVTYHYGRFPPKNIDWQRLLPLIGPANAAIARYEGVLHGVPNPNVLLSPLITQEATLSSRIEGTQATLGEVLEFEAEGVNNDESTPQKADIHEILNYRRALREALHLLDSLPLSQRLMKETHKVLMQGVRGRNKDPGEYRRIANWIGPKGCTQEHARFIPIDAQHLAAAMDEWEKGLHIEAPDNLVQLAILHAEFESIHPFLDGNGRLGRLMIPLYLNSKGLLSQPNFYISAYFDEHRDEYYDRLLAISRDDDWTGWCVFFLQGIIEQALNNQKKAKEIIDLYQFCKNEIVVKTKSQHALAAVDWIFSRPIFKSSDFFEHVTIPRPTAIRILRVIKSIGIIQDLRPGSGRRAAICIFPQLLNIAEGRNPF